MKNSFALLTLGSTLLAFSGLAAPAPTARRFSTLLVPMDKQAENQLGKFEKFLNEALAEFAGLQVKTADDLFPVAADDNALEALKRAGKGFEEGRAAFQARKHEEAELKLRATLKEYSKAVGALEKCGKFCDTLAMYAATMLARGDEAEAKAATLDLLSLAPAYELDRKYFDSKYLGFKVQVGMSKQAQLRSSLTVKTKPGGARIYVDGEQVGFSPATANTLALGKHLLRIERPGFKRYGAIVEITIEESEVKHDLLPTSGFKAYDTLLDKLAAEVSKGKGGPTMAGMGKTLNLDRALVGVLKVINEAGGSELLLGIFDMRSGKPLSLKRAQFQGEEYGQLKGELSRLVNSLINQANHGGSEPNTKSSDPLDGKSGMEDWSGDDKGGKGVEKNRKKSKDPLDGVNGTEDW